MKFLSNPAITAPPTGTRKFLSVLCTNASTLPFLAASCIKCMHLVLCKPYALFIMWGILYRLQRTATWRKKIDFKKIFMSNVNAELMQVVTYLINRIAGSRCKATGCSHNTSNMFSSQCCHLLFHCH